VLVCFCKGGLASTAPCWTAAPGAGTGSQPPGLVATFACLATWRAAVIIWFGGAASYLEHLEGTQSTNIWPCFQDTAAVLHLILEVANAWMAAGFALLSSLLAAAGNPGAV
jgi:hypothetical protein